MKGFIRGIKNIIKWAPIIWRHDDKNYDELYEIMIHKLEFMGDQFEKHDMDKEAKEIRNNATRLNTCKNETFMELARRKYSGSFYQDMAKCIDDEKKKELVAAFKLKMANARRLHNINKRKAFKIFGERIDTWWIKD